MAGITPQGFQIKTFEEIRADIVGNLQVALGVNVETGPSSRIGQFIDIVSNEIYDCWLALQAVYNSWYPNTASGVSLDNVAAITNTTRLPASASTAMLWYGGTPGNSVVIDTIFGKTGTANTFHQTSASIPIVYDAFLLVLSKQAAAGSIQVIWAGDTVTIDWDDTEAEIETKLEAVLPITGATVEGTLQTVAGTHGIFAGNSIPALTVPTIGTNTLTDANGDPITANVYLSNAEPAATACSELGPVTVPSLSITTIVSSVPFLSAAVNFLAGTVGSFRETDAELRERRESELQKAGTVTPGGIQELILTVPGVTNCSIIENDTNATVNSRPPHSYEVFVTGGDDDMVAQAIYDSKPVGISPVQTTSGGSARSGQYIDVNGNENTMLFSAPVQVPQRIIVNITTIPAEFPLDGADQIIDTLVIYFSSFVLGQDVYNHLLYTPVNSVPGIATLSILNGKTSAGVPVAATNVVIADFEVATLTAADVAVNIT